MEVIRCTKEHLNQLIDIIGNENIKKDSNIGYCSLDKDELKSEIKEYIEEYYEESPFFICIDKGRYCGVIGFDGDMDFGVGEVWGPFVKEEFKDNYNEITKELWNNVLNFSDKIKNFQMYINKENNLCINFAKHIGCDFKKEDYILELSKEEFKYNKENKVIEISEKYYEDFIKLHERVFKNPYYGGKEILEKLDDDNKVFILAEDNKLLGYIYCEVDVEFKDAYIHFVAVHEKERRKGIASKILNETLKWIFSHKDFSSVRLTTGIDNYKAVNLYKKVGFKVKDKMMFYELTR